MICCLCLQDMEEFIDIFDGPELNIAILIGKYFWFQPQIKDSSSTTICNTCWIKVWNFHLFYISIEEAHHVLNSHPIGKNTQDSNLGKAEIELKEEKEMNDCSGEHEKVEKNIAEEPEDYRNQPIISELEPNQNDTTANLIETLIDDRDVSCVNEEENRFKNESLKVELSEKDYNDTKNQDVESKISRKAQKNPFSSHDLRKRNESEKQWRSKEYDEKISKHMRLICELCNAEMPTFSILQYHFRHIHSRKGYVICCNKKLYKRILLVDHINKHLDPDFFKCNECKKVFADKQCLRNHLLIMHQPDQNKIFICEFCPRKFVKRYLLEQHSHTHVPTEERKHVCELCFKAFPVVASLTSHQKNVHSGAYGTMCHICAKIIRGKDAFEKHQLEHLGVKIPEVQCDKCGSWLKNKYSLQKHMRRHNDEGSLHVCNICGKTAPNQSALRSHLRYVHTSDRSYECSVCKKAFKKPLNLKEHMTIHTGETLYSCPHCSKTFNSNANMHSHRKKMHPKEWEENRKHRKGKIAKK